MNLFILAEMCFVTFNLLHSYNEAFSVQKSVRFHRFVNCPEHKNLPVYLEGVQIVQMVFKFERCRSRENLDSCEPYPDMNIKNLCSICNGNDKPWSPFVNQFEPPIECPNKKGTYVCRNGTFDGIALSALPISDCFWKVEIMIYEDGVKNRNLVLCFHMEGEILNV